MQPIYPINLMDFGDALKGDVVTRDGEFLGIWEIDADCEQGYIWFTPDGDTERLFVSMMIGKLCMEIGDWHRKKSN